MGVVGHAPYVLHAENAFEGVSLDVWKMIARNLGLQYDARYIARFEDAARLLREERLDVLVGPIAITSSLAKNALLTQPYYRATFGMAVPENDVTLLGRIRQKLGPIAGSIALTMLLVLLVAFFVWRAERRVNAEQFSKDHGKGLGDSIWFTVVTMMGVGYGDKVPITRAGRILSMGWMLVGIVMASSLTAGITTFFTVASLPHLSAVSPASLKNAPIAVANKIGAKLVEERFEAEPLMAPDYEQAFSKLADGSVKAVVGDRVELLYYLRLHPKSKIIVTETNYEVMHYGFAFSKAVRSEFSRVNVELLKLIEDGSIREIFLDWRRGAEQVPISVLVPATGSSDHVQIERLSRKQHSSPGVSSGF